MGHYETLRKRVKDTGRDVVLGDYKPWMHRRGYYKPANDPANQWWDERGFLHIEAPAKLTDSGRRLGLPHTEIIDDIEGGETDATEV